MKRLIIIIILSGAVLSLVLTTQKQVPVDDAQKLLSRCPFDSNAGYSDCLEGLLIEACSERQWKQEKLRKAELNIDEFGASMFHGQYSFGKWARDFNQSRDNWCIATNSFVEGSGTPSLVDECRIGLELSAIEAMDKLYAKMSVMIPDYEPDSGSIVVPDDNRWEHECVGQHDYYDEYQSGESGDIRPQFKDFPVSEIYRGTPASPDLSSNPLGQTHPTRITDSANDGPNFAGHYTVVEWGCGSPCRRGAVIDALTGKIYELEPSALGYDFTLDSTLLIASPRKYAKGYDGSVPDWWMEEYYEWTGSEFKLLGAWDDAGTALPKQ